jgi:glycosyltransferase involved in cell wall biosynthesis
MDRNTDTPATDSPITKTPTVAILLSTYNGVRYIDQQLQSFTEQTYTNWMLHWRDDGSVDGTPARMEAFAAGSGADRCVRHTHHGRLNVTRSFMALLRDALETPASCFAFADQDDVWLPDKLARGVAALGSGDQPVLYCAGHIAADEALNPIGSSPPVRRPPSFEAALTQNIAQGCTMMLNRPAAERIGRSEPPDGTWHDWWAYLVVTAGGGRVFVDTAATVLYRQHGANHTGVAGSEWRRALAALRRGQGPFIDILRRHVDSLCAQPFLVTGPKQAHLDTVARALKGGVRQRLKALRMPGFARQTWFETLLFRVWFLLA